MALPSRVASFTLLLYMLPSTWADLLPPSGKYVPYKVEVTSMPESTGLKLAIFPWSMSSGIPTADIHFVEPLVPVQFGRRVAGAPKFWAVRADALAELNDLQHSSQILGEPEIARAVGEWLSEGRHAVQCQGPEINPQFLAEAGENEFIDKFVVTSMHADQDKLECVVRKSDGFNAEIKDNLGSYAEPEVDSKNRAISLSSWGFSIVALGAICGLVWRLSSALRKTSGQSVSVQE